MPARTLLALTFLVLAACRPAHPAAEKESMPRQEADRLIVTSRQVRWSFPSSSGRPVPPDAPPWLEELANQRPRLVAAVARFLVDDNLGAATELAANLWRVFVFARDDAGGRVFLSPVLERDAPPTRARALALYGDGLFAFRMGDLRASRARSSAALDVARTAGDAEAEGLALLGLSRVELSEEHPDKARELAARSRERLKGLDVSYGQAPLHMLAQATRFTGSVDDAAALFEESLDLNRRIGDRSMVLVELHNLGHVELRRRNVDRAEKHFKECSTLLGPSSDPYDVAMALFNQAAIALARNERARAAELLRTARHTLAEAKETLAADDAIEFDRLEKQLASP